MYRKPGYGLIGLFPDGRAAWEIHEILSTVAYNAICWSSTGLSRQPYEGVSGRRARPLLRTYIL